MRCPVKIFVSLALRVRWVLLDWLLLTSAPLHFARRLGFQLSANPHCTRTTAKRSAFTQAVAPRCANEPQTRSPPSTSTVTVLRC